MARSDRQIHANRQRRGSALVGALVALIILSVVVVGIASGQGKDQDATVSRLQGAQAFYAAEAATNMAIKELLDNADRDADGVLGSISDDGNTANDPLINGFTRLWATDAVSGNTTTVTSRSSNTAAARAIVAELVGGPPAPGAGATVLLVVVNAAALNAQETARRSLIQGWGYTVTTISETASQAAFDAACRAASVVYVSETVNSGNVASKLTNQTLGVITEESSLSDELGLSTAMTPFTGAQITITSAAHYITSKLGTGTFTMFTASQPVRFLSGTMGGYTTLGVQPSTSNVTLAVMERGATLTPSGTAAGRRVYLPFGNSGMDINQLTADGLTIMRRSIEWCVMPVAWYRLDESSGATASDSAGAFPGTLFNAPAWAAGRTGNGLRFNGASNYVRIAPNSAFRPTQALSVTGWIRQTASWPTGTNVATILRMGDANPNPWQLAICQGRIEATLDSSDAFGFQGNTTLSLNTWHHVAYTWDGANVRIYLNGVLDNAPAARSAPISTDNRAVYLGGRIDNTDIVTGTVDDVRFFNRALTPGEVAALAAGGRPSLRSWTQVAP